MGLLMTGHGEWKKQMVEVVVSCDRCGQVILENSFRDCASAEFSMSKIDEKHGFDDGDSVGFKQLCSRCIKERGNKYGRCISSKKG